MPKSSFTEDFLWFHGHYSNQPFRVVVSRCKFVHAGKKQVNFDSKNERGCWSHKSCGQINRIKGGFMDK